MVVTRRFAAALQNPAYRPTGNFSSSAVRRRGTCGFGMGRAGSARRRTIVPVPSAWALVPPKHAASRYEAAVAASRLRHSRHFAKILLCACRAQAWEIVRIPYAQAAKSYGKLSLTLCDQREGACVSWGPIPLTPIFTHGIPNHPGQRALRSTKSGRSVGSHATSPGCCFQSASHECFPGSLRGRVFIGHFQEERRRER